MKQIENKEKPPLKLKKDKSASELMATLFIDYLSKNTTIKGLITPNY